MPATNNVARSKRKVSIFYSSLMNDLEPFIDLHDPEGEIIHFLETFKGWKFKSSKTSTDGKVITNAPTDKYPSMVDHLVELVHDVLCVGEAKTNEALEKEYYRLIKEKISLKPVDLLDPKYGFVKIGDSVSCFGMIIKLEYNKF